MSFTEDEVAYLKSQPLARLATVDADGQPDVVPVGFQLDGTYFYVGGRAPERTRKFLNVQAGQAKVALVVDDLVSTDPWTPRFLRVYGTAELTDRAGQFGSGPYMQITRRSRGAGTWTVGRTATAPSGPARAAPSTATSHER